MGCVMRASSKYMIEIDGCCATIYRDGKFCESIHMSTPEKTMIETVKTLLVRTVNRAYVVKEMGEWIQYQHKKLKELLEEYDDVEEGTRMQCRKCGEVCVYLGGTIGGTQLYGCPRCRRVFFA